MSRVTRDHDDVVIRLRAGREAGALARFLTGAAEAFRNGHIQPTNPDAPGSIDVAANQVKQLADRIHGVNS